MINFKYLRDGFPENKDQAEELWREICGSLAPECIYEDGELSDAEADDKFMNIHRDARLLSVVWPCPQHIADRCDDDISMYVRRR